MSFVELTKEADVRNLIAYHNAHSPYVVLDTETTGKDPFTCSLLDIQMAGRAAGDVCIFDAKFAPLLKELTPTQVWQNFGYDWTVLHRYGVDLRGKPVRDPLLLSHLYDENRSKGVGNSLDAWVQELYGDDYKEKFWTKYKSYQEAPRNEQIEYSCKDIVYTDKLYNFLINGLRRMSVPESLWEHVHRLAISLYSTELEGLPVDLNYLTAVGTELKPSIEKWKLEMTEMVKPYVSAVELDRWASTINKLYKPGPRAQAWMNVEREPFNWDSNKQLATLLYDKLKLPVRLNKARNPSTDDEALESLEYAHPIVGRIREYRGYQKVYTAFIEGTLERVTNGRVYPSFSVNGTVTGRISSSNPNLQQLPSKGEWAKVRGIYCAEPGHKILTCDYGQLEVCIAAHFSMDANLLKIVREGASKHDITAEATGLPRSTAKTLNFAMQYQCSPRKVAQICGCSPKEAEYIYNKYWEAYAGEKKVIEDCKKAVDEGVPIRNPFGRLRRFPRKFEKSWQRDAAYRQAYSSLIQGTGSDCTHEAFYTVSEAMESKGLGRALFEVHDEILIMSKTTHCEESKTLLESNMKAVGERIGLRVPLSTDCSEPLERWIK